MRKFFGPVCVMFLMAGLVIAAEGTISKVDLDKKTVTVKEGEKDNDYKFNDKVKVSITGGKAKGGKGQAKEGTYADFEKVLKVGEKLTFEAKDGMLIHSVPGRTIARNVGFQPGDIVRVRIVQGFTYDIVGERIAAGSKESADK
mgnify:CR=1 FL=1